MARFSKKALQEELQRRVDWIQKVYGFDPDNDSSQVDRIAMHLGRLPLDCHRAYSELNAYRSIAQNYRLDVIPHNFPWRTVSIGDGYTHYAVR